MEKLLLLFCFITVLFTQINIASYAGQPGQPSCNINPYDNISSTDMEYWTDIEDLSPVVCSAFTGSFSFVVEYTVLPEADDWIDIPLNDPTQLCENNGDFTFNSNLKSVASRYCGKTLALIITPYCSNGQNGIPLVMSFYIECDDTNEREGTNILARIEDLITEIRQEGDEVILGTPCVPTDIDCIKEHINAVINPYSSPTTLLSFSSKKENPSSSDAVTINFFPNPTNNFIHFNLSEHTFIGVERASLVITNAQGKTVKSISFEEDFPTLLQIDLTEWPSGIFFYRFSIDSRIYSGKLIKQ